MPVADQGITPERYRVIPRTLIFLTSGEKVLLLKGAPHKRLWANLYNGVGGHVEKGEDVVSAARRELAEETGVAGLDLWLCGAVMVETGGDTGIAIFVFRGECDEEHPVSSPDGSLEWVYASQIANLPLVEDLYTLLPRVLSTQPGEPPFSASSRYDQDQRLVITFME